MPNNFTEKNIKTQLTLQNYNKWLSESWLSEKEDDDDWNKQTSKCGVHSVWVIEQLGITSKEFANYEILIPKNISRILDLLDKGHLIQFNHDYKNNKTFSNLRKNNRYGNHVFNIVKGSDKYFVTQGFLNAYKHSVIHYNRSEIQDMLYDIIEKLSDYDNTKKWSDIDLPLYKKYFRTELFLYPKLPLLLNGKMHNIVLRYDIY